MFPSGRSPGRHRDRGRLRHRVAVSERLAADGAAVAVFDLDEESGGRNRFGHQGGGRHRPCGGLRCGCRAAIETGVDETVERLGRPTILVNNAGITPFGRFLEISRESFDQVMAVNLRGTFECCQVVIPHMVEEGWGRIVNISSSSAQNRQLRPHPLLGIQSGSDRAHQALAKEFGRKGITVNAVPPASRDSLASPGGRKRASSQRYRRAHSHHARYTGWASLPISRRPAPSCAATTPATSPGRCSASTAVGYRLIPQRIRA